MTDNRSPSGNNPPGHTSQRRARWAVVGAGLVGIVALLGIALSVARLLDDPSPGQSGALPDDEAAPRPPVGGDVGAGAAASEPGPTPDPQGFTDASTDIVVVETAWATTDFDEAQTLTLLGHRGTVSYANVAAIVTLSNAAGDPVETLEYFLERFDPGQVVAASSTIETPAEAIASASVRVSARGTVPQGAPILIEGVEWFQDDAGTVTVSGEASSTQRKDQVTVVGVLRNEAGEFIGSALGVLATVDAAPTRFELLGFPKQETATVELYAAT